MMSNRKDLARPIFTVGHSTRTIAEFVDLLRVGGVQLLVDVRSIPRSRTNPQYNLDVLPNTLADWQIKHVIIPELGGRRNKQWEVDPVVNGYWTNQSFHNYADYALTSDFEKGLLQLCELSGHATCAIMCSEAVWWRCHRRIIADYLMMHGMPVFHLLGLNRVEAAKLTPGAVPNSGTLTYPATGPS